MRLKVALVEDDLEQLNKYRNLIEGIEELECITAVSSAEKFLRYLDNFTELDLVLLDINLPGISGIQAIPKIKNKIPNTSIVMLTDFASDEVIFKALRSGASGYLLKNFTPFELRQYLLSIKQGGAPVSAEVAKKLVNYFNPPSTLFTNDKNKDGITKKEKLVIFNLKKGLSYAEIAEQLEISLNGVRFHVRNIYKKLGVNSRAKLIEKYKDLSLD